MTCSGESNGQPRFGRSLYPGFALLSAPGFPAHLALPRELPRITRSIGRPIPLGVTSWARQRGKPRLRRSFALPAPGSPACAPPPSRTFAK
jgi:hypothetical protein